MTRDANLKVRVKSAKGRKLSSTRWLERQLNDPFVREANRLGYRSRAAFKIQEIHEKFNIFQPGQCVLDLGAAPGGWSQIAAQFVNKGQQRGQVLAVDILPINSLSEVDSMQLDIFQEDSLDLIKAKMIKPEADIILSDMAPSTTGHKSTDHLRIIALLENALDITENLLADGGVFVGKVFRGGTESDILKRMKIKFQNVKHIKPKSSRANSTELYVVGLNYRK
jgi:23S rRNA (uridine2552-2'-O)-methyltransferase